MVRVFRAGNVGDAGEPALVSAVRCWRAGCDRQGRELALRSWDHGTNRRAHPARLREHVATFFIAVPRLRAKIPEGGTLKVLTPQKASPRMVSSGVLFEGRILKPLRTLVL